MSPIFTRDIQRTLLWILRNLLFIFLLRGYHPLWHDFPVTFEYDDEGVKESNTTSPLCFHKGFSLPFTVFDRL